MDQRKVAVFEEGEWQPQAWEDTFWRAQIGATFALRDPWAGFGTLVQLIEEPSGLEWHVAHPEGDVADGVYMSPVRDRDDLQQFFQSFADFFAQDGRATLAVIGSNARVTLDEHNWIQWEGDLATVQEWAVGQGFAEKEAELRFPHQHVFHPELTIRIAEIFAARTWQHIRITPS